MDGCPLFSPTSLSALNLAYSRAMAESCYVTLFLEGTAEPDLMSGILNVTIIAEQDLGAPPYYLYIAAVSHLVPHSWGIFSEFHRPARKMFPDFNGTPITFSGIYPETLLIDIPFTFSSSWWNFEPDDVYFIVCLQTFTVSDKQIHQSENIDISGFVGVEETPNNGPILLNLGNPYPNPFASVLFLPVYAENSANVTVTVYDMTGRAVRRFSSGDLFIENHILSWDGRDESGKELSAGMYRIELACEGKRISKIVAKMI
ncbi:T9SS type A sorting domain-containing protein [candidate division WOR-3 bacterium]|nr:T9SS type A sorting domain-containing protein [candidate division WOR-3 bacterium]